jgi:hypothetical protein
MRAFPLLGRYAVLRVSFGIQREISLPTVTSLSGRGTALSIVTSRGHIRGRSGIRRGPFLAVCSPFRDMREDPRHLRCLETVERCGIRGIS